ncbi:flagellar basal body rod C-terminal domain-containing protein [Stenotrophomonas sp. C2852]|uniref:flagellar basal body rod C-terminal domain-containing protein n=1 Tax=Stenotrophomonas sp. C2852 TaxID=3077845 RepID=UPI0013DA88AF|nr:flagellar basal body rod C-terminal domain-containing protein [Stenotrophomonas sp. C2852]MDV3434214.1 flagellar basal body rod C-terminal domain-containing protein [Stenotrophomonas sp. C2852]
MPIDSVLDVARDGLNYERLRLDAASRNIAAANLAVPAGQEVTLWQVGNGSSFGRWLGQGGTLQQTPAATRVVHDPGNPLADSNGQVRFPQVDLVQEMTTLMTASRGYEANVRSFNLLRSMMLRSLEIGAK